MPKERSRIELCSSKSGIVLHRPQIGDSMSPYLMSKTRSFSRSAIQVLLCPINLSSPSSYILIVTCAQKVAPARRANAKTQLNRKEKCLSHSFPGHQCACPRSRPIIHKDIPRAVASHMCSFGGSFVTILSAFHSPPGAPADAQGSLPVLQRSSQGSR